MPKAFRTDKGKYEAAIKEAKKTYFLELLMSYIKDGVLDTKALHAKNAKLYEEFRLAFKGIRTGCRALGIHPSAAALRAKVGPMRKQLRTLALAYIQENGLEEASKKVGIGPEAIKRIQESLLAPQTVRTRKKTAPAKARKK